MNRIITAVIRLYWLLIPEHRRRNCIYRISCSKHVYEMTKTIGWREGISAFRKRYHTCRPGYELIFLSEENKLLARFPDGEILQEHDLSPEIIRKYKAL